VLLTITRAESNWSRQTMSSVSAAVTDKKRLAGLRRLVLLDTPPNPTFDRLTRLASQLLHAPIALLTLVDSDRQFFLSAAGLPEPLRSARQTPLDYSICQHAVAAGRPLIIADARADPILAENPAVTQLGLASYLGMPLVTPDGHAVGTLCVIDVVPREWTDTQLALLADLVEITMDEIRLHVHERLASHRRKGGQYR
jgi:GAF domain-containing protein